MASLSECGDTTMACPVGAPRLQGSPDATVSAAADNNANGPRIHPDERPPTLSVTHRNGRYLD